VVAEEIAALVTQGLCLAYLTQLHRLRGDEESTRAFALRDLNLAQQLNIPLYIGAAQAHLAWVDWREHRVGEAEQKAQIALGAWGEFQYPFRWQAHWILCAVALGRDRLAEAVASAQVMLQPHQQRLTDDVTSALEKAVRSWEVEKRLQTREAMRQALALAENPGYL
jgi:eukaryotic-like serine/threonine-protein kinase